MTFSEAGTFIRDVRDYGNYTVTQLHNYTIVFNTANERFEDTNMRWCLFWLVDNDEWSIGRYCHIIKTHRQTCARIPTTFFFYSRSWLKLEDLSFISAVLMAFLYRFHVWFNSVFYQTKISRKRPRSCRSCRILDPRSEWVLADFHGVQIISSKKSPVICHITYYSMDDNQCNTQKYRRSWCFARIDA